MTLAERLRSLVDHDVALNLSDDDEQNNRGVTPGRLREVGEDYVVIRTISEEDGGFANKGAEWFVATRYITSIIHDADDCAGCLVAGVGGSMEAPSNV